ncbi:TetR/AcrR family transcriptional regulator [Streptomyces sp. NPDC090493]|uniref:TetR/AcrR family transcriptional regulator n=1 Tax=Streptomyces sp. NPDC090493 TaxID=3365964 RepID=UPI003809D8F7
MSKTGSPVSTRRRRLSVEERRGELLQVGAEVFSSQPFGEVWVNDVAKRAGVSPALLYHYFGNKRGFLLAVVRYESDNLLAATAPQPGLQREQVLQVAFDAYLDHLEAHPHGYRAVYGGAAGADTEIRTIVEANHAEQRRRILDWLTQGEPPTEQLRLAVHGWFAGVVAMCLDWLDRPALDRTQLRDLGIAMLTASAASAGCPVDPRPDDA